MRSPWERRVEADVRRSYSPRRVRSSTTQTRCAHEVHGSITHTGVRSVGPWTCPLTSNAPRVEAQSRKQIFTTLLLFALFPRRLSPSSHAYQTNSSMTK